MKNKILLKLLIIITIIIINQLSILCKSKIKDERRFQLGFGFIIGTHSLAANSEITRIYNSIKNNDEYYFPLSGGKKKYNKTDDNDQKTGLLAAHFLGGWEYGFQFRILWKIYIAETDIVLTPFDAANNGRFDFVIMPMIGIKGPLAIMPYIMGGAILTFSFYQGEYSFLENYKSYFIANENFSFKVGINIKAGFEFKIPWYLRPVKYSVGGYIQYTIKDFEEFNYIYWNYKNLGYSDLDAAKKVLSYQIRFGISLCYYIF